MSRYTRSYTSLLGRVSEINLLLRLARKKEKKFEPELAAEINALCRGAIVLLCSHIEGYIKELGELALERVVEKSVCRSKISPLVPYHISSDLFGEIKDTSDNEKVANKIIALFERDFSIWERTGPYLEPLPDDRFNSGFASPSYKKISAYFGRFGYREYKRDLPRVLKADSSGCINLIDHLVDIRNKIAHGDPFTSKTPSDLMDAVKMVLLFCRTTDDLFAVWCKKNLCVIR